MLHRQAIADEAVRRKNWRSRPAALLRYMARRLAFAHPSVGRFIERRSLSPEDAKRDWDTKLSQTPFSTYLGQTIATDSSNAMTATLIKYNAGAHPSVLDVGCCAGALASALSNFSNYLGIDVSRYAIECGRKDLAYHSFVELEAVDIRLFQTDRTWDVIVFNEVLYYLSTVEAAQQVARYRNFLTPDGIICIAMKHDPKSLAIFDLLQENYRWIDGIIWQRKLSGADYSIRIDRECPGFLLGLFKPKQDQ